MLAVVNQQFAQVAVATSIFQEQLVFKVVVVNVCNAQVQLHALNVNVDILYFKIPILRLLLWSVFNANLVVSFVLKTNLHIVLNVAKDPILRALSVWLAPAIVRLVQLMDVLVVMITFMSLSH